jgi:hypothetical protein
MHAYRAIDLAGKVVAKNPRIGNKDLGVWNYWDRLTKNAGVQGDPLALKFLDQALHERLGRPDDPNKPYFDAQGRLTDAGDSAVRDFQWLQGLPSDGIIARATFAYLRYPVRDPDGRSEAPGPYDAAMLDGVNNWYRGERPKPNKYGYYSGDTTKAFKKGLLVLRDRIRGGVIADVQGTPLSDRRQQSIRVCAEMISDGDTLTTADVLAFQNIAATARFPQAPPVSGPEGRLNHRIIQSFLHVVNSDRGQTNVVTIGFPQRGFPPFPRA